MWSTTSSGRFHMNLKYLLRLLPALLLLPLTSACQGEASSNRQCVPQCGNKECGSDGCGGICGVCGPGTACSAEFTCESSFCGNSRIDPGESCDRAITTGNGVCPTECVDDGNACTRENFFGTADDCDARCAQFTIIACVDDDGCCPSGCSPQTDLDCSANCDNGVIDDGETCDPPSSCPTLAQCDDNNACTTDSLTGSAANCSAACANIAITECVDGDGCCAPGCTLANDDDCDAECGDAQVTGTETCDRAIEAGMTGACPDPAMCVTDGCDVRTFTGAVMACDAVCQTTVTTACANDDDCCPATCTTAMDNDCAGLCESYCDLAIAYCTEADAIYADRPACITACQTMVVGLPTATTGNSVYCRTSYVMLAENEPATNCPLASETSAMCQ